MKTANLYIRVSTDEQAEKGYSQRSQEEVLRRYCDLKIIQINRVYFEDHSAKTFNRPVWKRLLVDLRKNKGKTDLVLFTKWDRFSRNAGDAYQMINTLRRWGVEPQAIEQPLDLVIPENKMMLAFYLAAPEVENDRRSLNVFFGQRRARKEGRWICTAPTGYVNLSREDGTKYIAPKEPQASIMKWAFKELAKGTYTVEQIYREAKEKGLPCGKNNFWNLIRNPIYCGKIVVPKYQDEEEYTVKGQHEPIITESLFYEVQDVLNGKRRFKERTRTKIVSLDMLPLRGFLRCPKCTRMLSGSASKGCGGYYYYYHCSASCRVRFRAVDVNGLFEKEMGHFTVCEGLEYIYRDWVLQKFRSDYNGGMNSQRAILDKIRELTEKIDRARDMALDGDFDATDFKAVKQDCENQIASLEAKLPDVIQATRNVQDNLEKAFAKMGKVYDAYMERDMKTKRRIISSVYPENLLFDGFQHRTNRTNDIAFNTALITKELGVKKEWTSTELSDLST